MCCACADNCLNSSNRAIPKCPCRCDAGLVMTTNIPAEGSSDKHLRSIKIGIVMVLAMTAAMWVYEIVDLFLHLDSLFAIRPRDFDSLIDIITAPWVHVGGIQHLAANTVPFLVLGCIVAVAGWRHLLATTFVIVLCSGFGVWLFAPPRSITSGASGVVFGYTTYLIVRGLFDKRLWNIVIGLAVLVIYGSVLWGVLPALGSAVSWQGHLFGALGGVLAAWLFHRSNRSVSSRSNRGTDYPTSFTPTV